MRSRGLTLVEVIFTASLLAIVFMFLLSIFPTAMYSVRQTEHRIVAGSIAMAILDECRAAPFSLLATDSTSSASSPGALGDIIKRSQRIGDDGTPYTARLIVSSPPSVAAPRSTLAQLKVFVTWHERGETHQLERSLRVASLQR